MFILYNTYHYINVHYFFLGQVFELDCTRRGCGIDDDCDIATEICQEVEEEADGGKSEVSAGGNYTCLPKSAGNYE